MSKFTYVVDHGDENPSVSAGQIVNGGKVVSVCFMDQLESNETARDVLENALLKTDCRTAHDSIVRALELI